jgi:hypothetical protein
MKDRRTGGAVSTFSKPTPETLKLVREFARRGFALAECARRLDVHAATYRAFLQRSPEAAQAAEAGKAERRDLLANAIPAGPGRTAEACRAESGRDLPDLRRTRRRERRFNRADAGRSGRRAEAI